MANTGSARLGAGALLISLLASSGCSTTMESGYKPRSLGSGAAQRKGYYASPFTPEAEAAKQERAKAGNPFRPTLGGQQ